LLVLDNFEHLLDAARDVTDLLASCANLKVLVTSRAALRVRWEHVMQAAPLALPDLRRLPPIDALIEVPSVALFVQRAQAVEPSFGLTPRNAAAVAELCVRLDGLPLAIELSAARIDVSTPAEILSRLSTSASGASRDLPARQQTLRAAFDWSYDLLPPEDAALFRRLAVFVGGLTTNGALQVAGSDALETLVQHSLLRREPLDVGEPRFRMLETVRAYALERLEHSGERDRFLQAHAEYMLELAEQSAPALLGPRQAAWLERLELERDNLSAALRWSIGARQADTSSRLARSLWRFWWLHGHVSEGLAWLDQVLAALPAADGQLRAPVLNGAGVLAHVLGHYERAAALLTAALEAWREIGSDEGIAAALHNLGSLAREQGDWQRASTAYEESLALERRIGNRWGVAISLTNLGALARDKGDAARAEALHTEALALMRSLGDERG